MEKSKFYRPEIDGLRALAIIPVLLFHAGVAGFTGGFIGVDIFFVISGFLITSILLRELKEGTFKLTTFWERRMRRIVPALFVITFIVLIAAYFIILFPVDFIDFGQSLAAQSLFLANIFFMRKHAYFAGPSESMPLLHTWSLSVEEQFYIGFPIILFFIWYIHKRVHSFALVGTLTVLTILFFLYNVYLVEWHPGAAFSLPFISYIWGAATNLNAGFFFIFSRAWELLIGALLATGICAVRQKTLAEVLSYAGLGAIVYAVVMFNENTPFPGYAALIPTLGTALVIASNTHVRTTAGRLLSFPVVVGVGLISYSLYLWHWPLIVFAKTLFGPDSRVYVLCALCLSFVLSYLTYRFVEMPFRKRLYLPRSSHMFIFGFAALSLLFASGLAIHFGKGFPSRASESARAIAAAAVDINPRTYDCFRKNYREIFSVGEPCLLGDQVASDGVDFVLWGDSHADAAMPIVDTMARENNVTGAFFGAGGCRPIIWEGVTTRDERCTQIKQQALQYIQEYNIKKVLFISAWESDPLIASGGNTLGLMGGGQLSAADASSVQSFADALRNTVAQVGTGSTTVYIMKQVPVYEEYDVRRAFTQAAFSDTPPPPLTQTLTDYTHSNREENQAIDALASLGLVQVIAPTDVFCVDGVCSMQLQGTMLYRDDGHITTSGALLLRPVFEDFFKN